MADLVLMLLVHLLLRVLPLLSGRVGRLVRRNVPASLVAIGETLLVRHLLLVIHSLAVLGGAAEVPATVLRLVAPPGVLVCGVPLRARDTRLPSVLCGR